MVARAGVVGFSLVAVLGATPAVVSLAFAGMPRGTILSADEQDADAETGITIARGNAEISVEKQRISGRADRIEIRPAAKVIVFTGRAHVTVGDARYDGEAVTCSSDFDRCERSETPSQTPAGALPAPTAPAQIQPQISNQGLQQPSALGVGAADTKPR